MRFGGRCVSPKSKSAPQDGFSGRGLIQIDHSAANRLPDSGIRKRRVREYPSSSFCRAEWSACATVTSFPPRSPFLCVNGLARPNVSIRKSSSFRASRARASAVRVVPAKRLVRLQVGTYFLSQTALSRHAMCSWSAFPT